MRTLALACLFLIAAPGVRAQDPKPADTDKPAETTGKTKLKALPKGETRVFKAIVMESVGAAQVRPKTGDSWKKVAKDDVYEPGATIRTGRKSHVALRVGPNATLLVERQSRVTIPEIAQSGATLKTRVNMAFGKMDVKVDRIGLRNDFGVSTPTATLAVRGTILRIIWSVIRGMQVFGVPGNKLRAIIVAYITGAQAVLSGSASTTQSNAAPWLQAYFETYFQPLLGATDPDEGGDPLFSAPDNQNNPKNDTDQKAADRARGDKTQGGDNGSTENR